MSMRGWDGCRDKKVVSITQADFKSLFEAKYKTAYMTYYKACNKVIVLSRNTLFDLMP